MGNKEGGCKMRGSTAYPGTCSGVGFPLGGTFEIAWVKATFHVDPAFVGTTIAAITINEQQYLQEQIAGGQDVVLEGRIGPVNTDHITVGLYPPSATIWDVTLEWADEAQAPAGVFAWLKKFWYVPTGGGIVGLALLWRKVRK